jgi:hypothetical protein
MGAFDFMVLGLKVGFQPANILFCFLGVLMGTLVGVLPGLGPTAAIPPRGCNAKLHGLRSTADSVRERVHGIPLNK